MKVTFVVYSESEFFSNRFLLNHLCVGILQEKQ